MLNMKERFINTQNLAILLPALAILILNQAIHLPTLAIHLLNQAMHPPSLAINLPLPAILLRLLIIRLNQAILLHRLATHLHQAITSQTINFLQAILHLAILLLNQAIRAILVMVRLRSSLKILNLENIYLFIVINCYK